MTLDSTGDAAVLHGIVPCKPSLAERDLPWTTGKHKFRMLGCKLDGAFFTLANTQTNGGESAAALMQQWQRRTLEQIQAESVRKAPFNPPGALGAVAGERISAVGKAEDGSPLQLQAAYFLHGTEVFQVAAYLPAGTAAARFDAMETYFPAISVQAP